MKIEQAMHSSFTVDTDRLRSHSHLRQCSSFPSNLDSTEHCIPIMNGKRRTAQQAQLPFPQRPFGNALRKAYLSRRGIRELRRGATQ